MIGVLTRKRVLLLILGIVSLVASSLVYYNSVKPKVVLSGKVTYYLPGQFNNCQWVMQADHNLYNTPGETTEIRIGIPAVQKMGFISGRLEIGPHNTLILAFIPPGKSKDKIPVVLTADYSEKTLPIDFVRFRWAQSSAITILLFSNKEECLASIPARGVRK
jgi:hypothetical protein